MLGFAGRDAVCAECFGIEPSIQKHMVFFENVCKQKRNMESQNFKRLMWMMNAKGLHL
jgi:hypothetical protein